MKRIEWLKIRSAIVLCLCFAVIACGGGPENDAKNLKYTEYLRRISTDSVRFTSNDIKIITRAMEKEGLDPNMPIFKMIKKIVTLNT